VYAIAALAGGALFAALAVRVYASKAGDVPNAEDELYAVRSGDKCARDLFAYSIAHLSLLFAALLVEHGAGAHISLQQLIG
jgi:protoheme IX farnesyltransferase